MTDDVIDDIASSSVALRSTAGVVVNRLRSRLSPAHVDMLIFLHKNYHHSEGFNVEDLDELSVCNADD